MISGVVDELEARISLPVHGSNENSQEIDVVIDTGYTGGLTLRPTQIDDLQLEWQCVGRGLLADGSECLFDVFVAEVDWDQQRLRILVDEADADPLLGMKLLEGYELKMQVKPGGEVLIQRLS